MNSFRLMISKERRHPRAPRRLDLVIINNQLSDSISRLVSSSTVLLCRRACLSPAIVPARGWNLPPITWVIKHGPSQCTWCYQSQIDAEDRGRVTASRTQFPVVSAVGCERTTNFGPSSCIPKYWTLTSVCTATYLFRANGGHKRSQCSSQGFPTNHKFSYEKCPSLSTTPSPCVTTQCYHAITFSGSLAVEYCDCSGVLHSRIIWWLQIRTQKQDEAVCYYHALKVIPKLRPGCLIECIVSDWLNKMQERTLTPATLCFVFCPKKIVFLFYSRRFSLQSRRYIAVQSPSNSIPLYWTLASECTATYQFSSTTTIFIQTEDTKEANVHLRDFLQNHKFLYSNCPCLSPTPRSCVRISIAVCLECYHATNVLEPHFGSASSLSAVMALIQNQQCTW